MKKDYNFLIIIMASIMIISILTSCSSKYDNTYSQNLDEFEKRGNFDGQMQPHENITNKFETRPEIDYENAAKILDVNSENLKEALFIGTEKRPNFENAALKLGITIDELKEALGMPIMLSNQRPMRQK